MYHNLFGPNFSSLYIWPWPPFNFWSLVTLTLHTLSPVWGFMMKFLLISSNMMVFLALHCSYLPQMTPKGFTYKGKNTIKNIQISFRSFYFWKNLTWNVFIFTKSLFAGKYLPPFNFRSFCPRGRWQI